MNPILLKPNDDTGAQVILMGKPAGNMNVHQYIQYTNPSPLRKQKKLMDALAKEFDVIVLEGAGVRRGQLERP